MRLKKLDLKPQELRALALRGDEIVICRDENAVVVLTPSARKSASFANFLPLAEEGRKSVPPGTPPHHSYPCDEHGLPK